ncbi:amidase [Thetidibacter halocola]|uniref:Amidase n=1 Tax=Thetidibacter halocola TaxID=2827239 RepID=A0A8J7WCU2_9RHOB|nr:amidase family protein [Thetidibacter halocola]MBS0125230.1 amidase [Thetidibacter halocola]
MAPARPAFTGPDLCALTARDAVAMLRKGVVSPSELIDAALARIEQTGPAINATVTLCAERARTAAATATGPLAGLPLTIKDLTPVAGVRTTWGTPALADTIPQVSHPLVLRLEERGGVVLGKSNTPEMGAGANTFNPVFGATRNPWDTRMNAGGSSGGAAAALATGETWLAHGSDLGGSLRTPASFCGIVGLRPSPGVAGGSETQRFDTMGVQGPMARNVGDVALLLDAMAGFDPATPVSWPAPEERYLDQCLRDPGPVRVAFSMLPDLAPATPEMQAVLRDGLSRIDIPGFAIEEATPDLAGAEATFRTLRALGFWTEARNTPERVTSRYKPALQRNIEEGRALDVDTIAEATTTRSRLYHTMRMFLTRYDVLACPVTGLFPLPVEVEYPPEVAGVAGRDYLDWLRFAFPATLCGLPALSLPLGFTDDGLPVGIQLIGRPRGEGRLLSIARAMEEALGLDATPIDPVVRHL